MFVVDSQDLSVGRTMTLASDATTRTLTFHSDVSLHQTGLQSGTYRSTTSFESDASTQPLGEGGANQLDVLSDAQVPGPDDLHLPQTTHEEEILPTLPDEFQPTLILPDTDGIANEISRPAALGRDPRLAPCPSTTSLLPHLSDTQNSNDSPEASWPNVAVGAVWHCSAAKSVLDIPASESQATQVNDPRRTDPEETLPLCGSSQLDAPSNIQLEQVEVSQASSQNLIHEDAESQSQNDTGRHATQQVIIGAFATFASLDRAAEAVVEDESDAGVDVSQADAESQSQNNTSKHATQQTIVGAVAASPLLEQASEAAVEHGVDASANASQENEESEHEDEMEYEETLPEPSPKRLRISTGVDDADTLIFDCTAVMQAVASSMSAPICAPKQIITTEEPCMRGQAFHGQNETLVAEAQQPEAESLQIHGNLATDASKHTSSGQTMPEIPSGLVDSNANAALQHKDTKPDTPDSQQTEAIQTLQTVLEDTALESPHPAIHELTSEAHSEQVAVDVLPSTVPQEAPENGLMDDVTLNFKTEIANSNAVAETVVEAGVQNTNQVIQAEDLSEPPATTEEAPVEQPVKRRRLTGKRPLASVNEADRQEINSRHSEPSAGSSPWRKALGHSLAPPERGLQVLVKGDGWGGGSGQFEALVTEADERSFTVIRTGSWEETHVLREYCKLLPASNSGECNVITRTRGRASVKGTH